MSRIYLHQRNGEAAEIRGAERAHMDGVCTRVALAALGFWRNEKHWVQDLFPPDSYRREIKDFDFEAARMALGMFGAKSLHFQGNEYETWLVMLNTAMAIGNDSIKLCARIHAQCEVWMYVEGKHRAWFADLCEKTLVAGIFRDDMGWPTAISMLRSADDHPVVLSYSVTEQFPADGLFIFDTEEEREDWHEESYEKRWDECMEVLRGRKEKSVELRPDNIDERFGDGMDLLKLQRMWFATQPK